MPHKARHEKTLQMILELGQRSQAATVLLLVSQLEDALERRISAPMENLSNTMHESLFQGYGPFASLSAKIDVSYAMGYIDNNQRLDFHVMRKVRNHFAHPKGPVHFETESVKKLVSHFRGYKQREHHDCFSFFLSKVDECWDRLVPAMTLAALLKRNALAGPPTSPGKS
jgi:hypothetical protein